MKFALLLHTVFFLLLSQAASGQNYNYVEQARSKAQLDTIYPYNVLLKNMNGDSSISNKLFAAKGKPTLLIFWLTTCYPCRMEMDAIASKYADWQKELAFNTYAISTDWAHNVGSINKRWKEKEWPFEFVWDYHKEFKEIMPGGLNGLPQAFVIDGKGKIVFHKRKYNTGDEDLLFEQLKMAAIANRN
jgi:cytochrome c biogenesis protein CcmG/thiol:disulfide interchange protein DsbE